jgi:hypothetical protein
VCAMWCGMSLCLNSDTTLEALRHKKKIDIGQRFPLESLVTLVLHRNYIKIIIVTLVKVLLLLLKPTNSIHQAVDRLPLASFAAQEN